MTLTNRIQRAVIRSSPYAPFRWIYAAAYGAMLLWLMVRVRRIPEIRYLELRKPRTSHRYGSSDLDVRAETYRLDAAQFSALSNRLADVLRPATPWMRILDFYIFGPLEAQLQRRLGLISFGDSHWVPLLGRKHPRESTPEQGVLPFRNTVLCRAIYEYGSLTQDLLQSTFDLHSTWTLYRRMTRIDDASDASISPPRTMNSESGRLRIRLRSRADRIAHGGPIDEVADADLEDLFALSLDELDGIATTSLSEREGFGDSDFHLVDESIRPATLTEATASCSFAVAELCSQLVDFVQGAILGGVPATSFDYRIYLILRDGLGVRERSEVFRAVRKTYTAQDTYRRVPNIYLRLRHPTILTPSMWRATSQWYHALRPVEEFFFLQRHGVVLWGKDLRDQLTSPASEDLVRSAAIAVADLRNGIWAATYDRRPRQLFDALLGRIPALWLLLARSTIATSADEALVGCRAAGFPEISLLTDLRARVSGLSAERLPATNDAIWKPALERSSIWMDEIAELALSRLEFRSGDTSQTSQGLIRQGLIRQGLDG